MAEAAHHMIIDHAYGLGKGVNNHWAAEIEAALLELLGQAFAHFGLGRNLVAAFEMIDLGFSPDMFPDQFAEAAGLFFLDLQPQARTLDRSLDLGPASDDAVILEQTLQ